MSKYAKIVYREDGVRAISPVECEEIPTVEQAQEDLKEELAFIAGNSEAGGKVGEVIVITVEEITKDEYDEIRRRMVCS